MRTAIALTASVLWTAACSESTGPVVCPAMVVPGITVEVSDASTGKWIAAGARGAVRDAQYVDSLRPYRFAGNEMTTLQAAGDKAGVYEVVVEHHGYARWSRSAVEVRAATCSVTTVALIARLEPLVPASPPAADP